MARRIVAASIDNRLFPGVDHLCTITRFALGDHSRGECNPPERSPVLQYQEFLTDPQRVEAFKEWMSTDKDVLTRGKQLDRLQQSLVEETDEALQVAGRDFIYHELTALILQGVAQVVGTRVPRGKVRCKALAAAQRLGHGLMLCAHHWTLVVGMLQRPDDRWQISDLARFRVAAQAMAAQWGRIPELISTATAEVCDARAALSTHDCVSKRLDRLGEVLQELSERVETVGQLQPPPALPEIGDPDPLRIRVGEVVEVHSCSQAWKKRDVRIPAKYMLSASDLAFANITFSDEDDPEYVIVLPRCRTCQRAWPVPGFCTTCIEQ
eukprot:SAG11_NODE_6767_length_1251_cov_21.525174_1_plen_323_part_01